MEHRVVELADGTRIGNDLPITIIAGPCQAESKDLCLEVAETMKRACQARGLGYVFKASFDKANRTSDTSPRGPGIQRGLEYLYEVRSLLRVPVTTDIHTPEQAMHAADYSVDLLQIPAMLSRQTDLLRAAGATGLPVNIKKGKDMSPWDLPYACGKVMKAGGHGCLVTERGTVFGHGDLVVDYRGLCTMSDYTLWPVVFDASHSVQQKRPGLTSQGEREFIAPLARAAVAVGVAAVFIEVHPSPNLALSDGPSTLALEHVPALLDDLVAIDRTRKYWPQLEA